MQKNLPYHWDTKKMLTVHDVSQAVVYCVELPESVTIKSIELENINGLF